MRWVRQTAVSLRTTAVLLAVLFALLLLTVVFPQASHDPQAYALAVRGSGWGRFTLQTLGLGEIVTGAPFLLTLALFFVNLTAVLLDRIGATVRRVRFAAPTVAQLDALLAAPDAARATCAVAPDLDRADEALRSLGYRTARVEGRGVWGVRHRLALLGFPIFHASFFLLCAGALQLYLTRSVVTLVAAEGQTVSTLDGPVLRSAALLPPLDALIRVERVDVALTDGKPTDLSARLVLSAAGVPQETRVNHPARWDDVTVLVQRAGIAPVLWLQDRRGYTLDRVVVPSASASGLPTRVPLAGGAVEAAIAHVAVGPGFPVREELPRAAAPLRLRVGDRTVFDGALRPGESAAVGDLVLRLDEVRYWVGLRLVRERGGGLLVAGFVLAVAGIAWRMVWSRREVAIAWRADGARIVGRAERIPGRAKRDVLDLATLLATRSRSRR
jgi:hypothetical protein